MINGRKMQQKICPLCNETYHTFIDYCFRDGSKLGTEGQEPEIEDTEYLTHTHKVSHNNQGSSSDDKTTPIDMTRSGASEFEQGEAVEEDLAAPVVMGNTQMFRKEDLMAMFEDDSTYNGELIDPDEETSPYQAESDTEDMEATETFDLSNPQAGTEKTEFEESIPAVQDGSPAKLGAPPAPSNINSVGQSPPYSAPKLASPAIEEPEKETSIVSLFIMGGLLGVIVAVVGFFFFYKSPEEKITPGIPDVPKNIPKEEVKTLPEAQTEAQPEAQPGAQPEEVEEAKNDEVMDAQELEVQAFINNKSVDMLLNLPISEEQLLTKLQEYGYSDTTEGEKTLPFTINGEMRVIQLTIPPSPEKMISFE